MSKKAWIISYIFTILTVICFITMLENLEWNNYIKFALICFFLFYPIIISKKAKEATYTKEQDFIFTHFLVFLSSALMCSLFFNIMPEKDVNYFIANSQNIEKANEIQNFLTTKTIPTSRHILTNENENKQYYGISIDKSYITKKDSIQLQADLLKSPIMDESVNIMINPKYTKNRKKMLTRAEDELSRIIWNLGGIEIAGVYIYPNNDSTDTEIRKVVVNIETKENADYRKIYKQIYLLTKPMIDDNSSAKIDIFDYTLENKAKEEYKKGNFQKALELLRIKAEYNIEAKKDADLLHKFIEINNIIKKEPNNYKLYIERGDLKNVPMFCCDSFLADIEGAIEDYNKALQLNPKAYEVYEKRGDAWAEVNHNSDKISIKAIRYPEDDKHVIDDYKKAIELTGGNDRLFEKLGDRYSNPKKSLKFYKKIKNPYYEYNLPRVPYLQGELEATYGYVPLKMATRYAALKQYNKSLKILDESLGKTKDENLIQQANNMKFYYNWRAGHYKQALKNADNCSARICKIIGIFF